MKEHLKVMRNNLAPYVFDNQLIKRNNLVEDYQVISFNQLIISALRVRRDARNQNGRSSFVVSMSGWTAGSEADAAAAGWVVYPGPW